MTDSNNTKRSECILLDCDAELVRINSSCFILRKFPTTTMLKPEECGSLTGKAENFRRRCRSVPDYLQRINIYARPMIQWCCTCFSHSQQTFPAASCIVMLMSRLVAA